MDFFATAMRMSAGVMAWSLHFAVIYGYTGLACARGWGHTVPPVVGAATIVGALATLAVIAAGYRDRARFESWMMAAIGAFALIGIVWEAIPALIVPVCG
jgi:hypothetical protein